MKLATLIIVAMLAIAGLGIALANPFLLGFPDEGSYGDRRWTTADGVRLVSEGGLVDVEGGKSLQFRFYLQDPATMSPLDDVSLGGGSSGLQFDISLFHDDPSVENHIIRLAPTTTIFASYPDLVFAENGVVEEDEANLAHYSCYYLYCQLLNDMDSEPLLRLVVG